MLLMLLLMLFLGRMLSGRGLLLDCRLLGRLASWRPLTTRSLLRRTFLPRRRWRRLRLLPARRLLRRCLRLLPARRLLRRCLRLLPARRLLWRRLLLLLPRRGILRLG